MGPPILSRRWRCIQNTLSYSPVATRRPWICASCINKTVDRRYLQTSGSAPALSRERKPFYVTTPIFYVNAAPHVGHLYSMVLADIIKRWHHLKGEKAILATGVDEHGMKIQQASAKAGSAPRPFCDKGAEIFKQLAEEAQIQNDYFVRTTAPSHRDAVQYAWQVLLDKELIYMAKHEGWYSVSDETFFPESGVQLIVDPPTGRKIMVSIETGKEVEWTTEQNYHFRLSAFRDQLLSLYENNASMIPSQKYRNEIRASLEAGLDDLSISRPADRLSWGIPVPNDPSQTIYVWLDALLNYTTILGYPWQPDGNAMTKAGWPADVQIIGKDITRFHCIYWPAFLIALDLPLPKQIMVHGHWTLSNKKMSKSLGNVVNPFFAIQRFGVDMMRFYLAHDGDVERDADYSNYHIIERYKKELQGGLGNLASRILRGKKWDVRACVQRYFASNPAALQTSGKSRVQAQLAMMRSMPELASKAMDELSLRDALKLIFDGVHATNKFLHHSAPWAFFPADPPHPPGSAAPLDEIIFLCADFLRMAGILLQPVMPGKAAQLLDMLGVSKDARAVEHARVGSDADFGVSKGGEVPQGRRGMLFPPLVSEV
ncbi:methionyl-tRNA synthetase [Rhizodiscina lignyota]|uniref:Probable methionine--tRNA ligase, mitochondrial n=1 Tax=Rhizodiscina lignyota TaxID=1504668 RepID=A0A9P4IIL1_9PEZI|nr:methionyl-tRNA synthetase [Rhizodiscina lignyota]